MMPIKRAQFILFPLTLVSLQESVCSDLHGTFYRFHALSSHDIRIRVKRNALGKLRQKRVTFDAYGRNFELLLKPGSPVLAQNFRLDAIHDNNIERAVDLNMDEVYHGKLAGDKDSWISAVVETGVWTALISTSSDAYYIEPRVNYDPESAEDAMILYRQDDVRTPNASDDGRSDSFCGLSDFPDEDIFGRRKRALQDWGIPTEYLTINNSTEDESDYDQVPSKSIAAETRNDSWQPHEEPVIRKRRYSLEHNTCEVMVLADSRVFSGLGKRNIHYMAKTLIVIYTSVDNLFKRTQFGQFYNGVRIRIREMKIFTSPVTKHYIGRYLKMSTDLVDDMDLLRSMTRVIYFQKFCTAHLTTQRVFKVAGVLGVATMAKPKDPGWGTGMCASTALRSLNVGLSTTMTADQKKMSLKMYTEVLAHEIGHTFGAKHDVKSVPVCAPPTEAGGKYLMWPSATTASNPNKFNFSPCSKRRIENVLERRAGKCLKDGTKYRRNMCGNGVVDVAEECDVGSNTERDPLKCCKRDCTLEARAVCSPNNHPCCSRNCTVASSEKKCHNNVGSECSQDSYCDGKSFTLCPLAATERDGKSCGLSGECRNGECIDFCALMGERESPRGLLTSCNCDKNATAMCLKCCEKPGVDGMCQEYGGSYPDGTPCLLGVCLNEMCTKLQDMQRKSAFKLDLSRLKQAIKHYPIVENLHIFLYTTAAITIFISGVVLAVLHQRDALSCGIMDDLS